MTNSARLGLAALLLAFAPGFGPSALGQEKKEVTDGFFDVPARESEPAWGLPEYLVTTGMAGLAVFLVCKSARRNG